MSPEESRPFRAAAGRARARLALARWFALLGRSALPVFAAAAALVVAARLLGARWNELPAAAALAGSWLAALALWAFLRRPPALAALALWDERAGRNEAFASAYCFERAAAPGLGEALHLARARALLGGALPGLRRDLPARFALRSLVLPIAFLALSASGLLRAEVPAEEAALEKEARRHARRSADLIEEKTGKLKGLKGLTPRELEAAEKLKASLERTAAKMREPGKAGARELIDELERRAEEAGKLAAMLEAGELKPTSSKMIDALTRHADTARLGAALKADDLEDSKLSAKDLAEKLRDEAASKETRKRIEKALEEALKAADEKDLQSKLGEKLKMAREDLAADRPGEAGDRFDELAEHFAGRQQRERARRQLERLVKMMRETGWNLSGRQLQQLKSPEYDGMLEPLPPGMTMLKEGGLPGNREALAMGRPGGMPGDMKRMGMGMLPGDAGGMPGAGRMGAMPFAGEGSGDGFGRGGLTPVPGTAGVHIRAGTGGLHAGRGTAPLGRKATKPLRATGTGVVKATPGEAGASTVRLIDPAGHRETAARSELKLATEFINAEEEALDEELLPLSRRGQVLRYFTALRRQLERRR